MMNNSMSDVYWNSRERNFSVREKGLVVDHPEALIMSDARFIVNAKARDRVRRTGKKTVHAVIRGTIVPAIEIPKTLCNVRYNPFRHDTFVTDAGPIFEAETVILSIKEGRPCIWASATS
jgi:hypothetical protein